MAVAAKAKLTNERQFRAFFFCLYLQFCNLCEDINITWHFIIITKRRYLLYEAQKNGGSVLANIVQCETKLNRNDINVLTWVIKTVTDMLVVDTTMLLKKFHSCCGYNYV